METLSIWHLIVIFMTIAIFLSPVIIGVLVMGIQRSVIMKHEASGLLKRGFYGYSWTYLLFGFFVPIFRGEIGIGLLHIIINVLTLGVFQTVMPYLYNRQYTARQLTSGWSLADTVQKIGQARMRLKIAT